MKKHGNASRRRGMTMIYVIVGMIAFFGFCSLAVDLGRVQTSKTELRRLADAAARAGAAALPQGASAAQSAAVAISNAGYNKVDGATYTLSTSKVTIGYWTEAGGFSTNSSSGASQAVQVGQITYNVPLVFGSILGMSKCQVTATSVAALVAEPSSTTQYVSAHGNPWLAGEPSGTMASVPDPGYDNPSANNTHPWKYDVANPSKIASAESNYVSSGDTGYTAPSDASKLESTDYSSGEPYGSPSEFTLTLTPGSIVAVSIPLNSSNVSNNAGYLINTSPGTYANGDSGGAYAYYEDDAANSSTSGGSANPGNVTGTLAQGSTSTSGLENSEHGISNILTPINSVVGVFMDQNGATYGADSTQETSESNSPGTPTGLNFGSASSENYTELEPELNQSFYVGNGSTSSGTQQLIVVPNNAYALFLGTMDGHEWSNNIGGFNATVTQYQIQIVH